jgi:hypothetical protein
MEVSQERGSTGYAASSGFYTQDGWKLHYASAPLAMNVFPVASNGPAGLPYSLTLQAATGKAVLAAGDFAILEHLIEGYRIARLGWGTTNAQPLSIGFWVYATIPGTMSVLLSNSPSNRSYAVNIAINAATTWEYKTLTIPGDTTGTWTKDNTIGLDIRFSFGCGSTNAQAVGSWIGATVGAGTTATTNFFATTSNTAQITGVIVLPGIELPSTARSSLIMRPYDQELPTCRRYYERIGITVVTTPVPYFNTAWYRVSKRATPTITLITGNIQGATVGPSANSPLEGMRQLTVASAASDVEFSIDARL